AVPVAAAAPAAAPVLAARGGLEAPFGPALTPRSPGAAPLQGVVAANDTGSAGNVPRETRVILRGLQGGAAGPLAGPAASRTRGLGTRFRSASSGASSSSSAAAGAVPAAPAGPPPETYR
ncbi:type VI secretion protein, partial [Erythrobacter sp. WG]|nr:type VI secretion protein [Erythrobacter sp. WG]